MCVFRIYILLVAMLVSLSNSAEKLFELMEDKNGGTYDALILGLFKVWHCTMKLNVLKCHLFVPV